MVEVPPKKDAYFCCPLCGKVYSDYLWDRHGYRKPKSVKCECGRTITVEAQHTVGRIVINI